ncbi:MAG: hypothetical protein CEO22_158 [Candidatus Berkelbacteria bacterium Gr01-1014_85]|uniref:Uncharacterized protein n=1 Tax=Candidatus Berkelbacteria bacterium Gr01-1014_85 TaxID=2017150 RepID=A0A554JCZ3_9BACT|nr:MAG: hypothetical protein CEO22_158 [Candidatus Berkelbacteria bacterium Gr01-1014_85]
MDKEYKGIIIEESLEDNRIIHDLDIKRVEISNSENQTGRWHLYTVMVSQEDIDKLAQTIKQGWYMHFWQGCQVRAIFKGRQFEFDYEDRSTWKSVLEYGHSLGIAENQLDFPID